MNKGELAGSELVTRLMLDQYFPAGEYAIAADQYTSYTVMKSWGRLSRRYLVFAIIAGMESIFKERMTGRRRYHDDCRFSGTTNELYTSIYQDRLEIG
jgi:hypothetical protein